MTRISALTVLSFIALLAAQNHCSASLILAETFEDPPITAGTSSTNLPSPWLRFSGPFAASQIWNPPSGRFDHIQPLAPPAGGNQLLWLTGQNTGVYRMSGAVIQANTTYKLSAAIGNDKESVNNEFWSLQLWSDTDGSGAFEGTGFDTFIGQQFGTSGTAFNPTEGGWAFNSFSFTTGDSPSLAGQELIVFLNNYQVGTSFYDNVQLAAVPEPSTMAVWGLLSCVGFVWRRRIRFSQ